jgi:membrane protease YdiL (CAAX protease family)
MIVAIAVIGGLAEAAAWTLVSWGRVRVWTSLAVVLAACGVAALATGRIALSPRVSPALAAAVGAGLGLALFGATRAFVGLVSGVWQAFRRDVPAIYREQRGLSLRAAMVAALAVGVGEELFWRGLVQGRIAAGPGRVAGYALAWLAYVGANLPGRNLAIVAGAVVGGAVWGGLALWTGGVLGCAVCHAVWTELMIAFPPSVARPLGSATPA